jgi:hypothetical protein
MYYSKQPLGDDYTDSPSADELLDESVRRWANGDNSVELIEKVMREHNVSFQELDRIVRVYPDIIALGDTDWVLQ